MEYEWFEQKLNEETEEQYLKDLMSQIYINATRCKEKFEESNRAVKWLFAAIPFSVHTIYNIVFSSQ